MKTTLLSIAALFAVVTTRAQYTQNFDGPETNLTGNCWSLTDVHWTNSPSEVINGTGSVYTNPATNGATTRDLYTPALNVSSSSLTVSFNYKLTSSLNGSATRFIEIGLMDVDSAFTSLHTIIMGAGTNTEVKSFNQTFTLGSTGARRLVFRIGGSNGAGSVRIIMDDLYVSADPLYGTGTCNSNPVAVNDTYINGVIGMPFSGNVLTNDNEPNGESMTPILVTSSPDGHVLLNTNGSFSFVPNPGFMGSSTTFTYQVVDNGFSPLMSNLATVTINFSIAAPLPVILKYFTAQLNSNKVDLKWATATEINASHFAIERSFDGRYFEDIATVMAFGNTVDEKTYQYVDNSFGSDKQVIYYRLRQVDQDGKTEYSLTRMIRLSKLGQSSATILTFPNPMISEVRITIPNNWQGKKVTYEMVNANGQTVRKSEVSNSSQTETLNVSNLSRGFYVVRVNCNGEVAQQKIVKQ